MDYTFQMCMHCGCNEEDIEVYKCQSCADTFCEACANKGILSIKCPHCDVTGKKLGYISLPIQTQATI